MYLDPASFSYVPTIEASAAAVRTECLALPIDAFDPWVQREMYGTGWDVFGLIAWGRVLFAQPKSERRRPNCEPHNWSEAQPLAQDLLQFPQVPGCFTVSAD